jgi:hypothetical protein
MDNTFLYDFNGDGDCVLRCIWNSTAQSTIKAVAHVSTYELLVSFVMTHIQEALPIITPISDDFYKKIKDNAAINENGMNLYYIARLSILFNIDITAHTCILKHPMTFKIGATAIDTRLVRPHQTTKSVHLYLCNHSKHCYLYSSV